MSSGTKRSRKTDIERLAELKEKQRKIQVEVKTRESRLKAQSKKQDDRRKLLVGAMILQKASRDDRVRDAYERWMDEFLTRSSDRALFEFLDRPADRQDDAIAPSTATDEPS